MIWTMRGRSFKVDDMMLEPDNVWVWTLIERNEGRAEKLWS